MGVGENNANSNSDFAKTCQLSPEGISEIQPTDLAKNLSGIQIIDVRRPDEFNAELGHVPGAVLKTLESDFTAFIQNVPADKRNETYVFVCRSGGRSGRATAYAAQLGFSRVYNMVGGMLFWNELGLKTEK